MKNILYCFVSHAKKISEDLIIISETMTNIGCNDYIIVYGGLDQNIKNKQVIHLKCKDLYCDLPEKINSLFKYVSTKNYRYYVKLDRTVKINRLLTIDNLILDYYGYILESVPQDPNYGKYHFNRCDEKSEWNNKEFNADQIKYCSGISYILSNRAAKYIAKDNQIYKNNIYEDYYVGYTLKTHNIEPENISIKDYFYDKEHPEFFV